jgi:hypothetical protein
VILTITLYSSSQEEILAQASTASIDSILAIGKIGLLFCVVLSDIERIFQSFTPLASAI